LQKGRNARSGGGKAPAAKARMRKLDQRLPKSN
jgi:hypothetical protein